MTRQVPTTAGGGELQLQLGIAAEIASVVTRRGAIYLKKKKKKAVTLCFFSFPENVQRCYAIKLAICCLIATCSYVISGVNS